MWVLIWVCPIDWLHSEQTDYKRGVIPATFLNDFETVYFHKMLHTLTLKMFYTTFNVV